MQPQPLNPPMPHRPTVSDTLTDLKAALGKQLWANSPFFIRLRSWEYWPFALVYLPIFIYWLWLSLKARSFFFFSAANPSIESGGMLGESKAAILDQIADEFTPKTLFVPASCHIDAVFHDLKKRHLTFPLIAKPNVGERGWRVEKLNHPEDLVNYMQGHPGDFIIQQYIDEPLELGVFYYRLPGQQRGVVSSIVQKEFLSIQGDGHSTMLELIYHNERAILQLPALTHKYGSMFHDVLPMGKTMTLVNIGNHCKGTKFLNANHLITPELTAVFDRISQSINGFYYGRYDLRCRSVADLNAGKHISILELNGAGAEPAHIYQPGFSIWEAYRVLFQHWTMLYRISRENHRRGVAYMTFKEARTIWKRIQSGKA